jgi:hypothetical protein
LEKGGKNGNSNNRARFHVRGFLCKAENGKREGEIRKKRLIA